MSRVTPARAERPTHCTQTRCHPHDVCDSVVRLICDTRFSQLADFWQDGGWESRVRHRRKRGPGPGPRAEWDDGETCPNDDGRPEVLVKMTEDWRGVGLLCSLRGTSMKVTRLTTVVSCHDGGRAGPRYSRSPDTPAATPPVSRLTGCGVDTGSGRRVPLRLLTRAPRTGVSRGSDRPPSVRLFFLTFEELPC